MTTGAAGVPFLVGTSTGPRPSIAITPQTAIPAGAAIIIATDGTVNSPSYPASISDGTSNTYSRLVTQGSGDPYISMWGAFNVAPLTTSATITINYGGSGSQYVSAIALAVTGLAASPLDQTEADHTTSKTLTLDTSQLGLNGEIAVAYWSATQPQGAPVIASNWNSVAGFQGGNNTHWVNMAWQLQQTASPVIVRASTPSSGNGWGGVLCTFMPQLNPTAEFQGGGSMTAFPVSPAYPTAVFGCGGSILGPAELAPVGPPVQPVFPAGYGPLAVDFEEWVQDALGYCSTGTVFRAEQHSGQSLAAATFTPLSFDTVLEDPWDGWSAAGNANQAANSWLVPFTGLYRVTFRFITTSTTSDQWRDAALGISGTNPAFEAGGLSGTSGAGGLGADASILVPLIGGSDYLQMLAWSGASTATDVSAPGRYAYVEITAVQTDLPG